MPMHVGMVLSIRERRRHACGRRTLFVGAVGAFLRVLSMGA
jgi:hypothetical protein